MAYSGVGANAPQNGFALPQALLNIYGKQVLYEALGTMRFEEFAVLREDFTKQSGENLIITKYDDVSGDPVLTEGDPMSTVSMSGSNVTLTVTEYGKAIKVSEKLLQLSWDDQLSNAAFQLGRHFAKWGPDMLIRDTVLGNTSNVIYGGAQASRGALTAADTFDTDLIREVVEQLQTNNAPKFNNDFYVCVLHPHQARYLKQDPDWVAANNYHMTRRLFNGEIGRWEDVIFIQSSHMPNGGVGNTNDIAYDATLIGGGAGSTNVYQACIFGDSHVAYGVALPVELRDGGVEDLGRMHTLGWYSIYGSTLLYPEYGFVVETA